MNITYATVKLSLGFCINTQSIIHISSSFMHPRQSLLHHQLISLLKSEHFKGEENEDSNDSKVVKSALFNSSHYFFSYCQQLVIS